MKTEEYRICKKCYEYKPVSEFRIVKHKRGNYLNSKCHLCAMNKRLIVKCEGCKVEFLKRANQNARNGLYWCSHECYLLTNTEYKERCKVIVYNYGVSRRNNKEYCDRNKKLLKTYKDNAVDGYIKQLIRQSIGVKINDSDLIQSYREQLRVKRLLKQLKNGTSKENIKAS